MPSTETSKPQYEPHLTIKVGSYVDMWHRFVGAPQQRKFGLVLITRCGVEIGDHWNVRPSYNPRADRLCAKCFPNGVREDGTPKRARRATDVASTSDTPGRKRKDPVRGLADASTTDSGVSETPDAGDGGATYSEGGGVLGGSDDGHVEELSEVGETGDTPVAGSPNSEGGQGEPVREHRSRRREQSARSGRRSSKGTN